MRSLSKLIHPAATAALACVILYCPCPAMAASPARHSALPKAALVKAREAEQSLAADKPDKAIAILKDVDKKYPRQPAVSLRLAQIYDTLNRNGYALFYYRRYVALAGSGAREMAVARVSSLELMAGINAKVAKAANEMGELTKPVAPPKPTVTRMLATEAKDGSLVPIRDEKDLERLQREGVPQSAPATPATTTPKPAIVIPPTLSQTPRPRRTAGTASPSPAADTYNQNRMAISAANNPRVSETPTISNAQSTPDHSPDKDAMLAAAFRKADSPGLVVETIAESEPKPAKQTSDRQTPAPTPLPRRTPRPINATPPTPPRMAYTREETPAYESSRAATFFNIANVAGGYAQVALINELKGAIVTLTITPKDNSEAISAILMPAESRTLYVKPANYTVTVGVATTDYSPITLMSANFDFPFQASRQYTRRFNRHNMQQVN